MNILGGLSVPIGLGSRRIPRVRRSSRGSGSALLLAIGSTIWLLACGSTDNAEVHPGDPQYPAENRHASATVDFTALVPTTLHPLFSSTYLSSAPACRRTFSPNLQRPLGLDVPVKLTRTGNSYVGALAIDRFLPGHCDWRFVGAGYETRDPAAYGGVLLRYDDRRDGPAAVRLDIWCAQARRGDPSHPELCGSLKFLASFQGVISPERLAAAPEDERGDSEATIGPNTRTVVVEFHDVDASQR